MASGSADKTIRCWNIQMEQPIQTRHAMLSGHTNAVYSLAILPDGNLASGSLDKKIHIWDVKTGEIVKKLTGHTDNVRDLLVLPSGELVRYISFIFKRDYYFFQKKGDLLLFCLGSCSWDSTIRVWDFQAGILLRIITGHTNRVYRLGILPCGDLVSCSTDRTVRIWSRNNK